jgi:hypothetical protein
VLEQHLWNLGRFSRTGWGLQDEPARGPKRGDYLGLDIVDGQSITHRKQSVSISPFGAMIAT